MKIVVVDTSMKGREHVFFNSAMLKMLRMNSPSDIVVYADKEHCNLLENELKMQQYTFKPIKVFSHRLWRCVFSDVFSSIQILRILFKTSSKDCVILLNRLPLTLLTYNLLNLIFKRKTLSVLHGELESIINFKNVKGLTKYYYSIFLLSYYCSNRFMNYMVLGEPILKQLSGINFGRANLFSIDHPYDYTNTIKPNCDLEKINIGIIGSALQRKNSQLIFQLADLYSKKSKNCKKDITFTIVGSVDNYIANFVNDFVEYNKTKVMYDNEVYAAKISALHYSLQFYDNQTNLALASGSFFDCLKYEKPILAIKGNPFVDYYFEKFGNIGFQFNTVYEMAMFLLHYDFDEIDYKEQVYNLKAAKNVLKLENIALVFKKEFKL